MSWTPISKAYVFAVLGNDPMPVGVVTDDDGGARFAYANSWLSRPEAFALNPLTLPLQEAPFVLDQLPGVLLDAAPDAWGKRVAFALHEQHPSTDIEWLLSTRGNGVGCLAFSTSRHRVVLDAPPALADLLALSAGIDAVENKVLDPRITICLKAGSSMGGARPKVSVIDDQGMQWLAKFNGKNDTFDHAGAEYACLNMASAAGIRVPTTRLLTLNDRQVLLVQRFDREPNGSRHHYLSGHALLGQHRVREADFANRYSYMGLAGALRKLSDAPRADLHELYTRMLFNVLIGNTDDHLRNHGFLYTADNGWRLSPAFDIIPHPDQLAFHAIGIGLNGREASVANALSCHPKFDVTRQEALSMLERIQDVLSRAPSYFTEALLEPYDQKLLKTCMSRFSAHDLGQDCCSD